MHSSPLHAPGWLISRSNILVTERCWDSSLRFHTMMSLYGRIVFTGQAWKNTLFPQEFRRAGNWCQKQGLNVSPCEYWHWGAGDQPFQVSQVSVGTFAKQRRSLAESGIPWSMNAFLELLPGRHGRERHLYWGTPPHPQLRHTHTHTPEWGVG